MTILNDMGVSKLSGNVYSGSELTFKVNWEHDLLIMFVEWYVDSISLFMKLRTGVVKKEPKIYETQ